MGSKAALQKTDARGGKKKRKRDKNKGRSGPSLAELADRHDLYQRSVQDAPADVDFLIRVWRECNGVDRHPRHFREDFCGTALLCSEWVTRGDDRTAEGVDLDPECLAWGREHNFRGLGDARDRIALVQEDVRSPAKRAADVRCAQNFSYQTFHDRAELADYFRRVREGLAEDGIFVLDMYGGTEAYEEIEEERELTDRAGEFTYVWEQVSFHPATHRTDCAIHFRFPDGSEINHAFEYSWRLYTMPELRDLLLECGFSEVRSYFEDYDEDGDGNGHFSRNEEGEACEGWLAYLVARR